VVWKEIENQLLISVEEGTARLTVRTPYYPPALGAFRGLGGRWDRERKVWVFDPRLRSRVEATLRRFWGFTPGDPTPELVVAELTVRLGTPNPFFALGRLIAERRFRDAPVRLGPGVVVVEGCFADFAGSRRHPRLVSDSRVVRLEVWDVPRILAEAEGVPFAPLGRPGFGPPTANPEDPM